MSLWPLCRFWTTTALLCTCHQDTEASWEEEETLQHTSVQYIIPLRIKFIVDVFISRLFHLYHVEQPIIIFNVISIYITYWRKDTFKYFPWNILIKYESFIFRNCWLRCWSPVSPIGNSDRSNHVYPTSKPSDKLSKVHLMFHKIICLVMSTYFI